MTTTELVPIHPRLLKGESLESWLVRTAHSNREHPVEFARQYLQTETTRFVGPTDWDFHYRKIECSLQAYHVSPNLSTVSRFGTTLGTNLGDLRFWTTVRGEGRRYCPRCLEERIVPYFSLIWRINLIPICMTHRLLLQARCGNPKCNAPVSLTDKNQSFDISRCSRCDFQLKDTQSTRIDSEPWDEDEFGQLAGLLYGNLSPRDFDWNCDTPEFFRALRLLIMYEREVEGSSGERTPIPNRLPTRDGREFLHFSHTIRRLLKYGPVVTDHAAFNNFVSKRKYVPGVIKPLILRRIRVRFRGRVSYIWMSPEDCNQLDDNPLRGSGSADHDMPGLGVIGDQRQKVLQSETESSAKMTFSSAY